MCGDTTCTSRPRASVKESRSPSYNGMTATRVLPTVSGMLRQLTTRSADLFHHRGREEARGSAGIAREQFRSARGKAPGAALDGVALGGFVGFYLNPELPERGMHVVRVIREEGVRDLRAPFGKRGDAERPNQSPLQE